MSANKIDKRPVSSSTILTLLKGDRPYFWLGAIFTGLSIFILTPLLIFITISTKAPYESYDFAAIEKYGTETTAKVTNIETLNNTTVNGKHPKVISYTYNNARQVYLDQFEILPADYRMPVNVNDEVKIKVYNNQSVIKGLKPFVFPYYILCLIPLVFFLVGSPFLAAGLLPALKKLNLYKNGFVKEATIVAMQPIYPQGKNRFSPYVLVNYNYTSTIGQKMSGKSSTHDMAILNIKRPTDKIKIFVSEEDETKSCLVPIEEAEKNGWVL